MKIGFGIQNTVTFSPEFISALTHAFVGHHIYIVSAMEDGDEARKILEQHGIRYSTLILPGDPELGRQEEQSYNAWKAEVVKLLHLDVFFEGNPEVVVLIQPPTCAFLACDEVMQQWLDDSARRDHRCRNCEVYNE